MSKPRIILVISLGRSGSTFFGQQLSKYAGYHYFGEKRFLWSTLNAMPILGRYFLHRNLKSCESSKTILDKTPTAYKYLESINKNLDIVSVIVLERALDSVANSSRRMEEHGTSFGRIFQRLRNYYAEYGLFFVFAALIRGHNILHAFGIRTGYFGRSLFSGSLEEESEKMQTHCHDFCEKNKISFLSISYDNFEKEVLLLKDIGVKEVAIKGLLKNFSRRST